MTMALVRRLAVSMVLGTIATVWLIVSLAPEPVIAAECCQTCETKDASCSSSCYNMSHEEGGDDSLEACLATCQYQLWERPGACWRHCSYCTPPAPCVGLSVEHYCFQWGWSEELGDYCEVWDRITVPYSC